MSFAHLLIGTFNPGKVAEIRLALDGLPLRLRTLSEFPHLPVVEENGTTYVENASLKAKAYASQTGLLTLADDSGLEVEALGGGPGILSARYGEPGASDEGRLHYLLNELRHTEHRQARFMCVMVLANPEIVKVFQGQCDGVLARAPSGSEGFGYDPIFVPDGYDKTFGELPASVKRSVSHRGKTLTGVREYLKNG